jgi:hypothetical protein
VALVAVLALRRGVACKQRFVLILWLATIAGFCAVGTVFSELVPIGLVLQLMPFRATLFLKIIGLFLCAALVWRSVEHSRMGKPVVLGLTIAMIVAALTVAQPIHIPGVSPASDLELAGSWAQRNTAVDALFVTPPDASVAGFMFFSERSTLGDYKLDSLAVWGPAFGHDAYARLDAQGCSGPWNPWCVQNRYGTLTTADFLGLNQRFGTCYALTNVGQEVQLPLVYQNSTYRMYALCS